MRGLFFEEILKEKKSSVPPLLSPALQNSVLISWRHLQELLDWGLGCWTIETKFQMNGLQFNIKCLLLILPFVWKYFVLFPKLWTYNFSPTKRILCNLTPFFNTVFVVKSVSTCVVSTNVAGLITTYNVPSKSDIIFYSMLWPAQLRVLNLTWTVLLPITKQQNQTALQSSTATSAHVDQSVMSICVC